MATNHEYLICQMKIIELKYSMFNCTLNRFNIQGDLEYKHSGKED